MPEKGFVLKIKGLDELKKAMSGAPAQLNAFLMQAMVASTTMVKGKIQSNIVDKGIQNTGQLTRSVQVAEINSTRGVVSVGEKYGGAVEFGRKPGRMPPVAPIERWAETKLGKTGIGFIIARKIMKQGTKANPFVEPAFEDSKDFVNQQFNDVATKLVIALGE